jgi:hypothetical protein
MHCSNCGNPLKPGAIFCNNCGQRVAPVAEGAPTAAETIQAPIPPGGFAAGGETGYQHQPPPGAPPPTGGPPPYGAGPSMPPPTGIPYPGPGYIGARGGPAGSINLNVTFNRIVRLLRLDTSVFREARDDRTALVPGIGVAAISVLVMALGTWLWAELQLGDNPFFDSGRFFVRSVLIGTITGTAAWAGWIAIAGFLLQQMFRRTVTPSSLFGPLGLAALPMAIGLLSLIDVFFLAFAVTALAGAALLTQVALQETTDATPGEAAAANLAGFLVFALVLVLLGRESADLAPGIFASAA